MAMMIKVVMALAALCLLTGGAGEVSNDGRPVVSSAVVNPYADDARAIENGEKLFGRVSCHGCHGTNARGGNGPDLTDDEWLRAPGDGMIFKAIKFGRKGTMMAPFKDDLSDDQIWYLVSYLRDLGKKREAEDK